jgi:hypothetical protein
VRTKNKSNFQKKFDKKSKQNTTYNLEWKKFHSLGQLAYVPIRFIEMEFVGQIGSPIQIPTDQLVILWVYP